MPVIETYSFGRMTIGGTPYEKDVLILPDGFIHCPWWRRSGHCLEIPDIKAMITMKPEVIVAGTGASGLMHPSEDLREFLRDKGIEFIALPTGEAMHIYNDRSNGQRTGGCFHLTC
jgi:hypothetical protein